MRVKRAVAALAVGIAGALLVASAAGGALASPDSGAKSDSTNVMPQN